VSHVAEPCAASCPSLSPVQQGVHIRNRVGIAVQAVHILFGLQLNLQSDAVSPLRTDSLPLVSKIYWRQSADDAIMYAP